MVLEPASVPIDPAKEAARGFSSLNDALEAVYTDYEVRL